MLFIRRNSSRGFLTTIIRRLSSEINLAENEEKKIKQQKYQELDKLQYRPLYLDAQATTPMVNFDLFEEKFYLLNIGSTCVGSNVAVYDTFVWKSAFENTCIWMGK